MEVLGYSKRVGPNAPTAPPFGLLRALSAIQSKSMAAVVQSSSHRNDDFVRLLDSEDTSLIVM